ncbi:hypothetical protein [Clavibacter zhangzhiyongii]|uniref:hypothetical protein n=1 Tax=Clavibacter zhangzhiyongii TaxID=2768071 RepID=UPI0039E072D9
MRRFLGIDLAWAEGTAARPARETGLACIDDAGRVLALETARGIDEVVAWVARWGAPGAVAAVDGPLLVANATGSRLAEKEVASRYGRLGISAYPSNARMPAQGAVVLRRRLEDAGWTYDDGSGVARDDDARTMVECYPYTTLVGAPELGFDGMKPRYKRLAPLLATAERRPHRAAEFRVVLDRRRGARARGSAARRHHAPARRRPRRRRPGRRRAAAQAPRGPSRRPHLRVDRRVLGPATAPRARRSSARPTRWSTSSGGAARSSPRRGRTSARRTIRCTPRGPERRRRTPAARSRRLSPGGARSAGAARAAGSSRGCRSGSSTRPRPGP